MVAAVVVVAAVAAAGAEAMMVGVVAEGAGAAAGRELGTELGVTEAVRGPNCRLGQADMGGCGDRALPREVQQTSY